MPNQEGAMTGDDSGGEWFWHVLVPGLQREEAIELADYAGERAVGWHGLAEPTAPASPRWRQHEGDTGVDGTEESYLGSSGRD
jgi:hypothetical protein